ncbi:AAA family ATPase [soil metagenome]
MIPPPPPPPTPTPPPTTELSTDTWAAPGAADRRSDDRRTDLSDARILVVDEQTDLWAGLTRVGINAAYLGDPTKLIETVHGAPWDVILAGPREASKEALERLAALRSARPDMGLVVTVNGHDPADLGTFVKARPDELVRIPLVSGELEAALAATLAQVRLRRGVETQSAARRVDHRAPTLARTILVTGPTGGSGKTMLALSLAHLLATNGAGRVIVGDLDAQFGEVSAALQLRPITTAYEVLFDDSGRRYDRKDVAEQIPQALISVPDGFSVLAAPADPVNADAIGADEVDALVEALGRHCDVLVLDCATGLSERTLAALDRADHTIICTQIDVPGIANLKSFLATVDRLGIETDARTVVLNKEIPVSGVTGADVIDVLGPVGGILPFEPLVTKALNDGRPMTAAMPTHEFSTLLRAIVQPLLPASSTPAETPTKRRRLFGTTKTRS